MNISRRFMGDYLEISLYSLGIISRIDETKKLSEQTDIDANDTETKLNKIEVKNHLNK